MLTNLDDAIKLLRFIHQQPKKTYEDIAKDLEISTSSVKRLRQKIKSLGVVIENMGTTRKPSYEITSWGLINKNEAMKNCTNNTFREALVKKTCLEKKIELT
jgi:predicted transcriptional regulator